MAIVAPGSLFKYAPTVGSGGTVSVTVAEIKSISLDGISIAEIDTSALAASVKTFVGGTKDSGTISISLFAPSYTAALLGTGSNNGALNPSTYANGADFRKFAIQFGPNTGTGGFELAFSGYVTSFNVTASVDGAVEADLTIRVTGAFTSST
jgi:hypothetical protein